ncbi:MAG: hypothetical protein ACI8T1_001387 [Verrucomicrobiales bacterium]
MNSWNGSENNLLFMNLGGTHFSDMARPLGCDEIQESRGVAIADLDKNGKLDIVITNNDAAPTIYLNQIASKDRFFRCQLQGDPKLSKSGLASSMDALGARVEVDMTQDGKKSTITRYVEAGSGYAAQSESTLHFGVGSVDSIDEVRIAWPSGTLQKVAGSNSLLDQVWLIEENKEPVSKS